MLFLHSKYIIMKNYYVAKFRVIVEGEDYSIETISGQNYDPNTVKGKAKEKVIKDNPGKRVEAVLLEKVDMDLEEYKKATGGTPGWLGGPAAD
jgi:hypothetical protein